MVNGGVARADRNWGGGGVGGGKGVGGVGVGGGKEVGGVGVGGGKEEFSFAFKFAFAISASLAPLVLGGRIIFFLGAPPLRPPPMTGAQPDCLL